MQDGGTALYMAVHNGHLNVVQALLEAGSNANAMSDVSLDSEWVDWSASKSR